MAMTKQEILQTIYNKLRFTGAVRNRQDFAEKIGYNYTCTSAALNGAERYLNDRFFTKVLRAFPQVSESYVRTGQGPVLVVDAETGEVFQQQSTGIQPYCPPAQPNQTVHAVDMEQVLAAIGEQQELTRRQQMQTEKALEQIDKLIEIIRSMSGIEGEGR